MKLSRFKRSMLALAAAEVAAAVLFCCPVMPSDLNGDGAIDSLDRQIAYSRGPWWGWLWDMRRWSPRQWPIGPTTRVAGGCLG